MPRGGTRALACLLIAALGTAVHANSRPNSEYHIKAEHLLNIIRLTHWNDTPGAASALQVCVLGDGPLASLIQWNAPPSIQNRKLMVRRVAGLAGDRAGCDVLFITRGTADLEGLLALLPSGVLTVTEVTTRHRLPSVVNLVLVGDRVAFDVNTEAAARARLTLSARLLGLARTVDGKQRRHD